MTDFNNPVEVRAWAVERLMPFIGDAYSIKDALTDAHLLTDFLAEGDGHSYDDGFWAGVRAAENGSASTKSGVRLKSHEDSSVWLETLSKPPVTAPAAQ